MKASARPRLMPSPADRWDITERHQHTCPNCNAVYSRPFGLCIRKVKTWRRDRKQRTMYLTPACKFPDLLLCYDCAAERNRSTAHDKYLAEDFDTWELENWDSDLYPGSEAEPEEDDE